MMWYVEVALRHAGIDNLFPIYMVLSDKYIIMRLSVPLKLTMHRNFITCSYAACLVM